MVDAICLRCGSPKKQPWKRCGGCGYDPAQEEMSLVKSVYLSLGRFEDAADRAAYREELDDIGQRIRAGESVIFDEEVLQRLKAQKRLVESVPLSAVWFAVLRLFLPAIGGLLVLLAILLILRHFR